MLIVKKILRKNALKAKILCREDISLSAFNAYQNLNKITKLNINTGSDQDISKLKLLEN